MPSVYVEDPVDEFSYPFDWKEAVAGDEAPGGGVSLSRSNQEATLVGLVPYNKIRSCARHFVGFSSCDIGAPYRLYREPPAVHPLWPQLRAESVNITPRIVLSNPQGTAVTDPPFGVVGNFPNVDSNWYTPDGNLMRTTSYLQAVATVRYRSFGRVRWLFDTSIVDYTDEWKRYTKTINDVRTEVLSADGTSLLKFKEGEPGPPAGIDHKGIPIPAPISELLAKSSFGVTAYDLPHEYVSTSPDYLAPARTTARLGTLNSEWIFDSPPGTLLLIGAKFEEVLFPVAPDDPDDCITGWTVTWMWEYFNPTKGVPGSQYYGHRLFPWRKSGLWFYCEREDTGKGMLPLTDHLGLMAHVNDPAVP